MKSQKWKGFLIGGRKLTKIGHFDPPRTPHGGSQGGGPRVHSGDSARKFNLVWESPLGFAISDRNPTNLTKIAKKVSFGPNSPLNDMNFSVWTKSGQNWPKIDQFWSIFDPLGPPHPPTPPPGQKNTKFSTFPLKRACFSKKCVFLTFLHSFSR